MYSMALDAFMRYQEQLGDMPCAGHDNLVYNFCCTLDIKYSDLFKRSRKAHHVRYRCLFANWCALSIIEVARIFDMNHTTVMHMRATHAERLNYDKEYSRLFSILTL